MWSKSVPKDGVDDTKTCSRSNKDMEYRGVERRKTPRKICAKERADTLKPLLDIELNLLRDAVGLELCISDWEKKGRMLARLRNLELWERLAYLRRSNGVLRYFLSLEAKALAEAMPRQRSRIMEALITQDLLDEENLEANQEDLCAGAFLRVRAFEIQECEGEVTQNLAKSAGALQASSALLGAESDVKNGSEPSPQSDDITSSAGP